MSECLYSDSPYLLVLSVLALVVSLYFPVMLERKMTVRRLPLAVAQDGHCQCGLEPLWYLGNRLL